MSIPSMSFNVRPLITAADITTTATRSPVVDLASLNWCTFYVSFGTITSTSADQSVTVTVEASTVGSSTGAEAIAFDYRLSGITTANTMGTVTAATASGVAIATTDDDKILEIFLDPAAVQAAKADARWVAVLVSPDAGASATEVAVIQFGEPRYPGATMTSTT